MSELPTIFQRDLYTPRHFLLSAGLSIGYIAASRWLIGFRPEQVYLVVLFIISYFTAHITRKFIIGFSVFILFWILFDFMKAFPNYLYQPVHIEDLYNAEKTIFGITTADGKITPNEYWLSHHHPILDILTGFFYLCWVPVPLTFAVYLFFHDREDFARFSLSFLLVNLIGFAIYYIYPAAPPWYVQQHGFELITQTPGNTAGLARFDRLTGWGIFDALYSHSSNVFAAMPSLHAAYPLIVFYFVKKRKFQRLIALLFFILMPGIWFSAVYNSHHYLLDVIFGILCALTGIGLFTFAAAKNRFFKNFLQMFVRAIT